MDNQCLVAIMIVLLYHMKQMSNIISKHRWIKRIYFKKIVFKTDFGSVQHILFHLNSVVNHQTYLALKNLALEVLGSQTWALDARPHHSTLGNSALRVLGFPLGYSLLSLATQHSGGISSHRGWGEGSASAPNLSGLDNQFPTSQHSILDSRRLTSQLWLSTF